MAVATTTASAPPDDRATTPTPPPLVETWATVASRKRKPVQPDRRAGPSAGARLTGPTGPSRRNKPTVTGSATDIRIKGAKRFANIFVSRLDPSVTPEELKRYLDDTLRVHVTAEAVTVSTRYSSFHVTCECMQPTVFMNSAIWPEGAGVSWWRSNKRNITTSDTELFSLR